MNQFAVNLRDHVFIILECFRYDILIVGFATNNSFGRTPRHTHIRAHQQCARSTAQIARRSTDTRQCRAALPVENQCTLVNVFLLK